MRQPIDIRLQHGVQLILLASGGKDAPDLRRAAVQEHLRVELGRVLLDAREQAVLEEGLGDGDEEGAAEGLEEGDAGRGDGDVDQRQHGLHRDDAALEADADAQAGEDLVAEPLRQRGGEGEGGDQAGADAEEDHAEEHDGRVVADGRDEAAGDDGGDDGGDEEREQLDACMRRRGALDGLEVDGQVEDESEEARAEEAGEAQREGYVAVLEQPRGQRSSVAQPYLRVDEDGDQEAEPDEEADDARVGPRVRRPAPLKGEEETHYGGDEDGCAD